MIRMSETGYPTDPSDGVLVVDNKDLGAHRNVAYIVNGLTPGGTYYFTAFPYSEQGVHNLSRDKANRACNNEPASQVEDGVYGIARDITLESPVWSRTDSAVGFTATASVGTTAGYSDFDTCYPWSGIVRETLSTGDVMVKIPKFWFQRFREGNIEHIRIADSAKPGFALHPAFCHAGVEKDHVYVAAYMTSSGTKSASSAAPSGSMSRKTARSYAKNKGAGWNVLDIASLSAVQMLILVEFANNDVQTVIGKGRVSSSSYTSTGNCDKVPNLTGSDTGTEGYTSVVWRGIEDIWGNLLEWVDGINVQDGTHYVCNDPSKYADDTSTDYTALSFTTEASGSVTYIKEEGLDSGASAHIMLPAVLGGASSSTYICDACYRSMGWKVVCHGGFWGSGTDAGLFTVNFTNGSSSYNEYIGYRLMYIPQ